MGFPSCTAWAGPGCAWTGQGYGRLAGPGWGPVGSEERERRSFLTFHKTLVPWDRCGGSRLGRAAVADTATALGHGLHVPPWKGRGGRGTGEGAGSGGGRGGGGEVRWEMHRLEHPRATRRSSFPSAATGSTSRMPASLPSRPLRAWTTPTTVTTPRVYLRA